jgi:cell division protein FtsI/penicillin-binding protein 2
MLRRFLPLLALLALSVATLLARLWDIQVVQHDVWATEAANIVRSYGIEPYRRGAILDRDGEVIVRDEKRYVLEFIWRDFRRGHPLGQLAMLRSLALARPVGLDEARRSPVRAARGYTLLSPDDLERFSLGGELDADVDYVPAMAAESESGRREGARSARRRSRAGDMRFYIQRLLELTPREVKELGELVEEEDCGDLSFVQLAGLIKDESTQDILRRVERDVEVRDEQLTRLAQLVEWESTEGPAGEGDRLVELIEERRRAVDDETADALFRIALGFSPVRLNEANLEAIDLSWLRSALDWDRTRMGEWRRSRGTAFVNSTRAGFVIARSKPLRDGVRDLGDQAAGDRFISALAHSFRADPSGWEARHPMPEDWRQVDRFQVLDGLAGRLAGAPFDEAQAQAGIFSFQDERLRDLGSRDEPMLLALLGDILAAARPGESPDVYAALAGELVGLARNARGEWQAEDAELVEALLGLMHDRFQRRVAEVLASSAGGTLEPGSVRVAAPWIERALETRRYVVRDRGARPKKVGQDPSIDLVLLVTRYREEFAGFRARAQTSRVAVATTVDSEQPVASKLIGKVRSPFLVDVLQQRAKAERLIDLQRKRRLPEEDAAEILALVDSTRRAGETVGGSGLEAWLDRELSGKSGYHEIQGLQDRVEGNRTPIYRGAQDGLDVTLTLDIDLQRAAEATLLDPGPFPPEGHTNLDGTADFKCDERWPESPVGALVLATVEGDVLAAASVPIAPVDREGLSGAALAWLAVTDGEALKAPDRTLTRPKAQPPGSVVKPLLAAYALQHLGLDPNEVLQVCDDDLPRGGTSPKKSSSAGYGQINCNYQYGHQDVDLHRALQKSCNVYFAALGERVYGPASMRDAYRSFGFGEPTGIRFDDDGLRSGLVDSYRMNPSGPLAADAPVEGVNEVVRQFLGNGLAHADVNVMQVARAYAGLATGELPRMRLVRRVGDLEVPSERLDLGISSEHLATIHEALGAVVRKYGSAQDAWLTPDRIGFKLAAKTGSADYREGAVPPSGVPWAPIEDYNEKGMRKHTWLAGWFPAEEPRFVITVYVHDTSATASHSAAYVARKFLLTDAVQNLMAEPVPSGHGAAVEASAKRGRGR